MRKLTFVVVAALLCASCGRHDRKLGQSCSADYTGTQADCVDGLFCLVSDICLGQGGPACTGGCVKRCTQDADCPAPMKCTFHVSIENGGGFVCQ